MRARPSDQVDHLVDHDAIQRVGGATRGGIRRSEVLGQPSAEPSGAERGYAARLDQLCDPRHTWDFGECLDHVARGAGGERGGRCACGSARDGAWTTSMRPPMTSSAS